MSLKELILRDLLHLWPDEDKIINDVVIHRPKNVKELTHALLDDSIDPNKINALGNAPLHSLASRQFKKKDKLDLLYTFLTVQNPSHELNINLLNSSGNTALHLAVEMNDIEFIKILLAFGAHINQMNCKGKTPLDFCCMYSYRTLNHQDSFIEIEHVDAPVALIPMSSSPDHAKCSMQEGNGGDIMALLKECGAELGKNTWLVYTKERVRGIRLQAVMKEKEGDKKEQVKELVSRPTVIRKLVPGSEKLSMMYRKHWMRAMEDPIPFFSAGGNPEEVADLGLHIKEMRLFQMAGCRILVMDGGGMKGLLQLEILDQIEQETGRKIVELFDWIVGTSTGGIIALGLVQARLTVRNLRQIFHTMKDPIFGSSTFGIHYNTEELTKVLKEIFLDTTMSHHSFPKVLVSAVSKETTNLKLKFFGNYSEIDPECETREVWKVARYISAAPMFFMELDNYVDGGVLANNPSSAALTLIQDTFCQKKLKIPIALVASVGTGVMPEEELGRTDAQEFLFFGSHWFKKKDMLFSRASNLKTLLANAITESEQVSVNMRCRCREQGIDYYRFSPNLHKIIGAGETDRSILIDMVLHAKKCLTFKKALSSLILRFPIYSNANRKIAKLGMC